MREFIILCYIYLLGLSFEHVKVAEIVTSSSHVLVPKVWKGRDKFTVVDTTKQRNYERTARFGSHHTRTRQLSMRFRRVRWLATDWQQSKSQPAAAGFAKMLK